MTPSPRPLLRVYDGSLIHGATSVPIAHAHTLRMMVVMLDHMEDDGLYPAGLLAPVRRTLTGKALPRELRALLSHVGTLASQARKREQRDANAALTALWYAVKVALVLTGDRVEKVDDIRGAFAEALRQLGIDMLYPGERDGREGARR